MEKSNDTNGSLDSTAQMVLSCADLNANMTFFIDELGFQLDVISPADDPRVASLSVPGLSIRLVIGEELLTNAIIRMPSTSSKSETTTAPNGTLIEFHAIDLQPALPAISQSYVVSRLGDSDSWVQGRAGMLYRDLIAGRQNGRFIASHIKITDGGNIKDYPHYHNVRFQMIYCYRGWVRLVYEDQGEAFILQQGDCVLQPPGIRHRVLESSDGLEVIEIGCPAEHDTFADHDMTLPTFIEKPLRAFAGQQFVRFQRHDSAWSTWRIKSYESVEFGFLSATDGLAAAGIVRPVENALPGQPVVLTHDEEFLFFFILSGSVSVACHGEGLTLLNAGDACVIPCHTPHALVEPSVALEMLEVRLCGEFTKIREPMSYNALSKNLSNQSMSTC